MTRIPEAVTEALDGAAISNRERDVPEAEPMPKARQYQSAAEILTRPATDLTLRGAANQIAMVEIKLSPIDNENAGR
jgi:hypothetical protein